MVVPHVDKRPAGPSVLKVRVAQVGPIDSAIVLDGRGNMEIPNFFAVRIADDVSQSAVIHSLRTIFRVPDNFINKIAKVQHKCEPVRPHSSFVLENHSPIGVLGSLVGVLAAHKGEAHRPRIVNRRCCDSPADAAAASLSIRKAVPIHVGRHESTD